MLRFEVSAETLATFRSALQRLREQAGEALDNDNALLLMSRAVVAGSTGEGDTGRSSYQLAVTLCERCGESFQHAGANDVRLEPAVAERVACDAQVVDTRTNVGAERVRATQTIPPALRRQVVIRDRRRCTVPGCRHSAYVDVHHGVLRTDGGANSPQNLVVLCGAHHRAVHRGQLIVTGSASAGLRFQRADGSDFASTPSAAAIDLCERVFRALVGMGFREREARSALERLRVDETATPQSVLPVLRQALAHLCPARAPS